MGNRLGETNTKNPKLPIFILHVILLENYFMLLETNPKSISIHARLMLFNFLPACTAAGPGAGPGLLKDSPHHSRAHLIYLLDLF